VAGESAGNAALHFGTTIGLMLNADVVWPFVALFVILVVLWYAREGRNLALENQLVQCEFGSPLSFHGTLVVDEYRPGVHLRLVH